MKSDLLRLCLYLPVSLTCLAFTTPLFAEDGSAPPQTLKIATWNIEWFFDHETYDNRSPLARRLSAPSREEWEWRLDGVAQAIARLDADILALQEIENRHVLWKVVKKLRGEHNLDYEGAFIEGLDFYTEQDVAILARSGLNAYGRFHISYDDLRQNEPLKQVQKHMFAHFEWGQGEAAQRLTLVNVHLKAMPDGVDIRKGQGRMLRQWMKRSIDRGDAVILLGDMNTEELFHETTNAGDIGILRGLNTPDKSDDLFDAHELIEKDHRHTHLLYKQFDRIFVSQALAPGANRGGYELKSAAVRHDACVRGEKQDEDHWNIFYKIDQTERDLSDHYPILATFER